MYVYTGKNIVHTGFGSTHGGGHPLGSWSTCLVGEGWTTVLSGCQVPSWQVPERGFEETEPLSQAPLKLLNVIPP